ncbi:hypothetical protein HK097_007782 [Rhizophlyctis rosea]|uniref:Zinc finger C2H2 LYAR-type domain-containing protein n=1 Tax=Rhizophlyctis rosea TaxID=64517 RepID=A0AAD5SK40_9FUNG|nr:hypothetical protein HK097_007782 [Rhizophlyctis rosea]
MVSFVCDYCQETLKKPKLDQHTYRCHNAQFTCIDCNTTFTGTGVRMPTQSDSLKPRGPDDFCFVQYRTHTSCISEAEKYQGALYKGKKGQNGINKQQTATPANTSKPVASDSLIAQIKRVESQPEPETPTPSKKRKADDAGEDVKKAKKEKTEKDGEGEKEKKKKKKKEVKEEEEDAPAEKEDASAERNDETLDSDFAKTVPLAVVSVLGKGKEMSFKQLKKKVIKKFSKHPQNKLGKEVLAEKVDEHFVLVATDAGVVLKQ